MPLLAFLLALILSGAATAAPTITRRSSPIFYTDFGKNLNSMYVAYQVTNDGVARSNVWATISGFTGAAVSLASNENGIVSLGAMAPGESKLACFYLTASALASTPQGHTIAILDDAPGIGATLSSQTFSFTAVEDTIAANANKVTTTVTTPNPPSVGGIVTITVTGSTGTIGAAQVLAFTPASYGTWRADALQLISTSMTFSGGNTGVYTNTLLIPPGGLNASDTSYSAVYNFRIVNTTGISTPVSPVGYISSGVQVKHTDTGDFANLQPILPANNTTLLSKTASTANLATGGTVTYTLRLTNSGPYNVELDRIVDVLPSSPSNATYESGSSSFNGVAFANPSVSGQSLTWTGTFVIPANSFREFAYRANIPNVGGSYVNRATAFIENTRIDSTTSTSDDSPAQATVAVPSADVVISKEGPGTAFVGNTITYTINYQNSGPGSALNVVIRDTLPAQVTFLGASGGGAHAEGVVTWPAIDTLENGASGSYTVTVRAANVGNAINVASSTSDSYDPAPINNDGSAAASRVGTVITVSADVETTKAGSANAQVGVPITYTITTTNQGPSPASDVTVTDTLPAELTFQSASGGGTYNAGVVTWPPIPSLAAGATVSYTITAQPTVEATFTNVAQSSSTSPDPTPGNNNGSAAAARVTTTTMLGYPVSGFVYRDADLSGFRSETEGGTGLLPLFVKAVPLEQPGGPAFAAAAVDPVSGAYSFEALPPGSYRLVLDDNDTASDVTPVQPAGWTGTESSGGIRAPVAVAAAPVPEQNFGLARATTLRGRVFIDDGAGGGIANDGSMTGGELGLAGSVLRLTDQSGAITYSSASSDGAGAFVLFIPGDLAAGAILRVQETQPAGYVSTGATVGNTAGDYDRGSDVVTFMFEPDRDYSGVNFGNVPVNTLAPDGQLAGLPGTVVFYPHVFTAGSGGQVTFSAAPSTDDAALGWTSVIHRDLNANGRLDATEPVITGSIGVSAGDRIHLLVKVFIPATAPIGSRSRLALAAAFTYTNAAPALSSTVTRHDLTTVGDAATAGLTLLKSVDKGTARPGETLNYTISFSNQSPEPLANIVIHDVTPAFSTFAAAANDALPEGLTSVTLSAPSAGQAGPIRWTFGGALAPGSIGSVTFSVVIDQ